MHFLAAKKADLAAAQTAHVLGNPVKHSLSPLLHNAAYKYLNLDFSYSAIETDDAGCREIIDSLAKKSIFGLSLTMPFKDLAFQKASIKTDNVARSLCANTLVFRDGEIAAENTDIHGIVQTLKSGHADVTKPWIVLGTGATARSAVIALQEMNVAKIIVMGRDESKLAQIRDLYQVDTEKWDSAEVAGNLLSTIPVTAQSNYQNLINDIEFLFDVTYANWPSPFSQIVSKNSGVVMNGLSMLIHQAVLQIEIMTGQQVPAEILFAALPE